MTTIALCGAFDMNSYGDLLFPLLAERRLGACGMRVRRFAPSASSPGLGAPVPSEISTLRSPDHAIAGVVVGGGYIIHTQEISRLLDYPRDAGPDSASHATWIGATVSACLSDVPIVWNAPGVPFPFPATRRPFVQAITSSASYLSVRDTGSARLLPVEHPESLCIVPDPVAELASLWSTGELAPALAAFRQRHHIAQDQRLWVINVRSRSLDRLDPEGLGNAIDLFAAATGLLPVLLPLGDAHGDSRTAASVARGISSPHVVYDDPVDVREITSVIAHASLYVGASLHGYIVATSYAVPGVLVARPSYSKFKGYLEHVGWLDDLTHDWRTALDRARMRVSGPATRELPPSVFAALDAHWARITDELSNRPRHQHRRQALLAALRHSSESETMFSRAIV